MKDTEQLRVRMILNRLETIEDKLGRMAHEIPDLDLNLRKWQDKETKDISFYNYLVTFLDEVNNAK